MSSSVILFLGVKMKIEDKVIELIDYEEYIRQCKLEEMKDAFYPAYGYDGISFTYLKELAMAHIVTEKIIDKKFFIYKFKEESTGIVNVMLPVYNLATKPIPKEEQYVVDILHTNILDDMVFLTICNNIDFSKVRQKSLKLYTEDKRLSYCPYSNDNLMDYTTKTARGFTTVIRLVAEKNLIPLLPFLTKIEFVPIVETISPD
jgi:hypothetical protein